MTILTATTTTVTWVWENPLQSIFSHFNPYFSKIGLFLIHIGKNRFSLLQKAIPDISKQMLVNQLREMEEDKLIERIIYAEIPPRVENRLSEHGKTVLPIIGVMADWGKVDMKIS
jgi:DNA-binding HxlR family transcriptional regulator